MSSDLCYMPGSPLGFGGALTLTLSPVCMYICARVYVRVGTCVRMHTKARGHLLELCLGICSPWLFEAGFPIGPELRPH